MESLTQELAMDFMHRNDPNFYANDIDFAIFIGELSVSVESIWYSDKDDKIYIHCGCEEFEGDLDIDSLSEKNQKILRKVFREHI